ncbi:hypothetical protein CDD81_1423 [Ophiocordyceps australis]|uniref:Sulfatase N-terminal domain-containing protein n=1 Tax=Ophiocordyceps australis TaxID=1399860 RepID=A0A2C5XYU5_9HYPO|nr:hypothetical protein CDD81_1423 [Ophiocordyceps australis]
MATPRDARRGQLLSNNNVYLLRCCSRIWALLFASRFASRLAFSLAAVAALTSKFVHVYAHADAFQPSEIMCYTFSFYFQDVAFLLVLRYLFDVQAVASRHWIRGFCTALTSILVGTVLLLQVISIGFFTVAGSELHWRNIGVAGDSSSWTMLLTGLFSCSMVFFSTFVLAWLLQDLCYVLSRIALIIVKWPFVFVLSKIPCRLGSTNSNATYHHVPRHDVESSAELKATDGSSDTQDEQEPFFDKSMRSSSTSSRFIVFLFLFVSLGLIIQLMTTLLRPEDSSLTFMSWTLLLLPFIDFAHSSPTLAKLLAEQGNMESISWDNITALTEPPVQFSWLPKDTQLPGFEDWFEGKEHYNAREDPLKISNLDDSVLPKLKGELRKAKIRHVVLVKLESTRKDVFPIKKDGLIWERLSKSFKNASLPHEARERISTLTPTANFLTGDYNDGFQHSETRGRGGINVNNAYTTSSYTLKSLAGTLCGITPLVADMNMEESNHVYQPCLAHIFKAFNKLQDGKAKSDQKTPDFTSFAWRSSFIQSVTNTYDKQDSEMGVLGYDKEEFIYKEYLNSAEAKLGKVDIPDINYYGMPEVAVKDYIRDAFATAKKDNERVFLTHLTSTTHHPFGMPKSEKYIPLGGDKKLNDLSHYVNAVGYVDRWLGQILEILDEEGVADETLLVFVGDHGLSLPENKGITPYYNANVGNFHVPLVLSHPKLPQVDIDDAVVSLQILPTILDLLVETGSLSKRERRAASDLMRNYEGQSLIRPLRKASKLTGEGDWQFSVMNPGRATIAVRETRQPKWRLIVPVVDDQEWRFTDLEADEHEEKPLLSFKFDKFLSLVQEKHGSEAAKWTEKAAFMTRWWLAENAKRWRYQAS